MIDSNGTVNIEPEKSTYFDSICESEYSKCMKDASSTAYFHHSRHKRNLSDLNLIDAFMFNASTEKIQDAEFVARIIVERATGQKLGRVIVQPEKSIRGIDSGYRGVRLDLFISEMDNEKIARVYDIEPNNYGFAMLPKRERYNQALSDVKMLETNMDYDMLPEYISIWILPDDPFDDGRMIYTVKNMVAENGDIVYNDGVKRLFLNAKGTIGGDESLHALLNYFCSSCADNATDPELKKLHSIVNGVKCNKEVGEQYMHYVTWQELAEMEAKKVVTEELTAEITEQVTKSVTEEVTKSDIKVLIKTCIKLGATNEEIAKILMEEYTFTKEQADECICQNR